MSGDCHARARSALASLDLKGANRALAIRWLSQWRTDKPPKMLRFAESMEADHKTGAMYCRIGKNQKLTCISAGPNLRVALGFDLSNQDLLSLIPAGLREERLSYWWQVVEGSVAVSYRPFKSLDGGAAVAQGVALPFSDELPDGARYFLMHTNWRPVGTDWIMGNVTVEHQRRCERRIARFSAPHAQRETVYL